MVKYGLIGYPLTHSFSKKYFSEKFEREGLSSHRYDLYELENLDSFEEVLALNPELKGLNVTIPYKEKIIRFLDQLEPACKDIGAVNVIKLSDSGQRIGYNTDYLGFKTSLVNWLGNKRPKALVLGTGGASKAVVRALLDLSIDYCMVSRKPRELKGYLTYEDLYRQGEYLNEHELIINTTPLGTFPQVGEMPNLPLDQINSNHYVYDLVYNPEKTRLMECSEKRGAAVKNGLEMLHLQAEAAWEIWNA
ncbi:shikimate dehydrogenase family protein [Pararhodonellum marinum]|uniref:shikimate dehydrogenase family protein n=1 Tax=Pararhodonellum marinum TaxID=2755358 RepID=UPI00188F4918|nr:shikimate dehydrogenase [Pararhodonellum marinum]